jgi:hypothetical protein
MSKIPQIQTPEQIRAQIIAGRKYLEEVTDIRDCTPRALSQKLHIPMLTAKIIFANAPNRCPTCI